jgi:2-iminoacetate synthase
VKRGKISYCCTPNAMITLKEYLEDYASPATREKGEALIRRELEKLPDDRIRNLANRRLIDIANGERDFRF